ncbi:MAG: UvrD-helicase domain-containing protein, partial [Nanoarchaeota archaeon]|nr:UvrD-helicase domain-containing protein [Nanoarchaeota archaeon]
MSTSKDSGLNPKVSTTTNKTANIHSVCNPGQQKVIESTEGIFLVDAGAGTGKTFAITKRYIHLLDEGIKPSQILLVTFTNNAAENMKDKIINDSYQKHNIKELLDANISTFHSFCNTLLKQHGFSVPKILGINDNLSMNYQIIENKVLEERMFRQFFNKFQKKHIKDYSEFFDLINNKTNLPLYLIKKLCCHGIFPTKTGWFNNGEELLIGNWERYQKIFQEINKEKLTEKGNKKDSDIAATFRMKLRYKSYHQKLEENLVFNGKSINGNIAKECFDEDRKELLDFIHKLYFEYVVYSIKRNKLNFDFLIMLTFIMLFKDHKLREQASFDYVMVDEFQDTNEIQFMLTLLLMKTNNLCVVGDWKQGIYGFRNATIENVTLFDERLDYFKKILNTDYERVKFSIEHKKLSFDINYRSAQNILNFSENALLVKGSE